MCPRLVVFRGDVAPAVGGGASGAAIMVVRAFPGVDDGPGLGAGIWVTHAVRCAPPGELAEPAEVVRCNPFLAGELRAAASVRAVVALGILAHEAVLLACGVPSERVRFRHGVLHDLPDGLILADAHPYRHYASDANPASFEAILVALRQRLGMEGAPGGP